MVRRVFSLVILSVLAAACDSSRSLSPATSVRRNITVPVPYVASVKIADLGGVDGGTSYGSDVNDSGTVAGWATIPGYVTGTTHIPPSNTPFTWSPATGMRFISICCGNAYASGINDSGVVVGTMYPKGANAIAWMYRPGRGVTNLAPLYPAEGAANLFGASKIGKDGRINGTGWGKDRTYDQNGILWNDGSPSVAVPELALPDSTTHNSIPNPSGTGVDDDGEAVGWVGVAGAPCWLVDASGNTTWAGGGSFTDLEQWACYDVNTSHNVVGATGVGGFVINFPTGQVTQLGSLAGPNHWSSATGINEENYVVGASDYILPGTTTQTTAAFIWSGEMGMVNLGSLKVAKPACSANAMNHDMQGNTIYVAGQCVDANGYTHAVRWTVMIAYRLVG